MTGKAKNRQWKKRIRPAISVIIPARNEASTIRQVIQASKQIGKRVEILVIANGCKDATVAIAKHTGAKVIEFPEPLGHDVGRAVGAAYAKGKILLFLDADMVIDPNLLLPFIQKIRNGFDIALNSYPRKHTRYPPHATVTAKHALNLLLGRNDLKAASMTTVPFAITKKAARSIGYFHLAIPPLAHAIAIDSGLRVGIGGFVNVGFKNPVRWRKKKRGETHPIRDLIVGDHLEAISYLIRQRGERGGFHDFKRDREQLIRPFPPDWPSAVEQMFEAIDQEPVDPELQEENEYQTVTIIPAYNESKSIAKALKYVKKAGCDSILVVDNGSTDKTKRIAQHFGADVLFFPTPLGHDVGRAVGAQALQYAHAIFTDADIKVSAADLSPYVKSIQSGTDVALNNLNRIIPKNKQFDSVCVMKRFLNIVIKRPELGICSLTAVPNGLSWNAIQTIGAENLAIPPLAYAIAAQKHLKIRPVSGVDVVKRNKLRPDLHRSRNRPLEKLILGDHVEAISYLQSELGVRGDFPDDIRKREWLECFLANRKRHKNKYTATCRMLL
ncbi:glycosyltransferase family 2 protein [Fodinisporobacter ferrooxydans]|uniref:Glycosyltransferase family 2 protein n=1 Tax=Fodinisporobacter ferrooxydans TaxID=2901836 RepID=A0ABY4CTW2_9BACL|nr:glycosyltransferase family 2 protein [Alicyclobacillaceae bacterium MYW30-H2]